MFHLLLGAQYIKKEDRKLLSFCEERVTKKYIRNFSKNLILSDPSLSALSAYPAEQLFRYCILLSFAAMKSDDFFQRNIYGFQITIRSTVQKGGQVFLDADEKNILHIAVYKDDPDKWEIRYLNPIVFSKYYSYGEIFILAVLMACKEATICEITDT